MLRDDYFEEQKQQRIEADVRAYRLYCAMLGSHAGEGWTPPEPGGVFPSLAGLPVVEADEADPWAEERQIKTALGVG